MKLKKNKRKPNLISDLLAGMIVLEFFFLLTDLTEYLLTEKYWLLNSLDYKLTGLFFLFLVLIASFINWEKLILKKIYIALALLSFFTLLVIHLKYNEFYRELQNYPKIKNLSKTWGIKGSWVKVSGRNFSDTHEQGKVYLGEQEMTIKKWSDKEIIFEIPLNTNLGEHRIYIENYKKKRNQTINSYQVKSI